MVAMVSKLKKMRVGGKTLVVEKGIDIMIATDMFSKVFLESECECCVLISGDSDFVPALKRVRDQKKNMLVFSARGRTSREISDFSEYIYIGDIRNEIEMTDNKK